MNVLLNNAWREKLSPVVEELLLHCPETMSRKIKEANVQQGFTYLKTKEYSTERNRLLCVGSFADTAFEALQKQGYDIVGIDPAVNMSLNTFFHQNHGLSYYDTIFSTSVLEHVEDDEQFIDQICKLLKVGGMGILTCDFKEGWMPGEPKPGEDVKLYTTYDLTERLNSVLERNKCQMVGEVNYSGEPDFCYGGVWYSFASYMFIKLPA